MKKTTFLFAGALLGLFILTSCGSKKKEEEKSEPVKKELAEDGEASILKSDIEMEGNAAQYLKINQDEVIITGHQEENDIFPKVSFEIEFTPVKKAPDFNDFPSSESFNVVVCDVFGEELHTFRPYSYEDVKRLEDAMKSGSTEPVTIRYSSSISNPDDYIDLFSNANKMKVENVDYRTTAEYNSSGSSDEDSSTGYYSGRDDDDDEDDDNEFESASTVQPSASSNTSSSNDWDAFLDEYEEYVDNMVSLVKKANNGDPTAMVDYAKAMRSAQSLSKKLEKAKSQMTPAQISRYTQILRKYSGALQ